MYIDYYEKYLSSIYRKKSGELLSQSSVNHYMDALNKINKLLSDISYSDNSNLYEIDSLSDLKKIETFLKNNEEFIRLNKDGHQMYSSGLHRYMEFAEGKYFENIKDEVTIFDTPHDIPPELYVKERYTHNRDRILINQAEKMVCYKCEIDNTHKTFIAQRNHKPYVEGHHIIPLKMQNEFNNNLDMYANILILCPTCHRFFHYGEKSDKLKLINQIYDVRNERLAASGISLKRKEFIDLVEYSKSRNRYV
ncbi:MAG: HNH endonuclease [Sphaerochaetaceae bacterium]|nr:HNH endonuclease [Sphaerochaetaceae bacterium]